MWHPQSILVRIPSPLLQMDGWVEESHQETVTVSLQLVHEVHAPHNILASRCWNVHSLR